MAEVVISSVTGAGSTHGMRKLVFVTADIGYVFYQDSTLTAFVYAKTTDGGATWGSPVQIQGTAVAVAGFDVWFDQWTPGDSGTLIHTWYFDATSDDLFWRSLNTSGDTLGTERVCFAGASVVAGRGSFCSGTKAVSGYLYVVADLDAGAERVLVRSTDSGTNWSAQLAGNPSTFLEATIDECMLFPASGTGDNNDIWGIYQDADADALTMKMWDSSAAAQVESATMQTCVESITDGSGQRQFAGSVRHSDGHVIVVSISEFNTATADMQCWDVSAVNAGSLTGITAKTDITTNKANICYPMPFIDQTTDDIYVAYNGKRDGTETFNTTTKAYYTKSTDGGGSWSAGDTAYQESAAAAIGKIDAPLMGARFYFFYRNASSLRASKVNSLTFAAGPFTQSLSGALSFVGADAIRTGKGLVAALSFVGTVARRVSHGLTGALSFTGAIAAAKLFTKALTAALSFVGAQRDLTMKGLASVMQFSGADRAAISHKFSAVLSFVGASAKRSARSLAGALPFVGTFTKGSLFFRNLTAALSFSGAQRDLTGKAFAGALSFSGATRKAMNRSLAGALSFVGTVRKSSGRALTATLSFSGSIRRAMAHKMTGALSFVGGFVTQLVGGPIQFTQSLIASLSFSGAQRKATGHKTTGALSFVGTAAKRGTRSLAGALAFVGNLATRNVINRILTASLSFVGTTAKATRTRLSGALSFVASLAQFLIGPGGGIFFRKRRASRGAD